MTFGPMGLDLNGVAGRTAVAGERSCEPQIVVFTRRVAPAALTRVEVPVLGLISLIFALSIILAPGGDIRGSSTWLPELILCPFFAITHIPCLFCGITRSFMAMGALDIRQAFIFHPLGPVLFAGMLVMGLMMTWSLARHRRITLIVSTAVWRNIVRYGVALVLAAWMLKVVIWRQTGLL